MSPSSNRDFLQSCQWMIFFDRSNHPLFHQDFGFKVRQLVLDWQSNNAGVQDAGGDFNQLLRAKHLLE